MDKSKYLGNELKYFKEVLKGGKLSSTIGDFTYKFEQEFAKSFKAKYAIACNSGTSALHMGLEGLNVGYGDEVVVPALSVIMNTTSVLHANAIPVYADVNEKNFTIDVNDVKRKITSKTKAIVSVSLYGYPSKIEELKKISNGIPIIEDNCEHLGELRTDVAIYSLEGTKHLSCGEMGVLLTNDENIALKARKLANHGFITTKVDNGRTKSNINIFQNPDFERHDALGWNYRVTEFQSAIALAQLENKEEVLNKRRKYAKMFYDVFGKYDIFLPQEFNLQHTFWTFAVRFLENKENWKKFHNMFVNNDGNGFWSAWKLQYMEPLMKTGEFKKRCPSIYSDLEYKIGLCPTAEKIQPQIQQYKLNYRDERLVLKQIKILEKTLKEYCE